jgi:hypothetical protein
MPLLIAFAISMVEAGWPRMQRRGRGFIAVSVIGKDTADFENCCAGMMALVINGTVKSNISIR